MAILKKAYTQDFENIYPLLRELNNTTLTKQAWRELFKNYWNAPEDYFGYMLKDGNRVVGFLGFIFSHRMINDTVHPFCNLTSLIVKENYRSESLNLIFEMLRLKEYTITVFTPALNTHTALRKIGFEILENYIRLIFPFQMPFSRCDRYSIEFDKDAIKASLNKAELDIYDDHARLNGFHLLLKSKTGYSYVIATKSKRKNFFFAHIHYISNIDIFTKFIKYISFNICLRMGTLGLLVDERYFKSKIPRGILSARLPKIRLFKSSKLTREEIDTLYSEFFILNN